MDKDSISEKILPKELVSHNDDESEESDNDNPPPAASGELILAEQPNNISNINLSANAIYSVFHWLGSSLYTITTYFTKDDNSEYERSKVADSIEKLNKNLAFLDKKINYMNDNIIKYSQEAQKLYKFKNKSGAIHQIRLKKMYEREIRKMESLKFNIESNILHLESVDVMMETVGTIKDTSDHFQIINKSVDISKLEDTIEEMFEQKDTSNDIHSILSDMHKSSDINYDEDELLKELEELNEEEQSSSIKTQQPLPIQLEPNNQPILEMPVAPSTPLESSDKICTNEKKTILVKNA